MAPALWVFVEIGTTPIGSILGRWISEAGCLGSLCSLDLGAGLLAAPGAAPVHTPPHPDARL